MLDNSQLGQGQQPTYGDKCERRMRLLAHASFGPDVHLLDWLRSEASTSRAQPRVLRNQFTEQSCKVGASILGLEGNTALGSGIRQMRAGWGNDL